MFKKTLLLLLTGFLAFSSQVRAQDGAETSDKDKSTESSGPNRFWQATLEGGHYMVALDRISSVSRHKYLLDGAVIVDEVTVETLGQALARFYFISPVTDTTPSTAVSTLADRGREIVEKAAERVSPGLQDMVVKKYPVTSHAKTIEYRILSEKELTALYTSVRTSWESGRGRQFSSK